MVEDTVEVLRAARDMLSSGWCQFKNSDGQGGFCLRAAIGIAAGVYERDGFGFREYGKNLRGSIDAMKLELSAGNLVREFLPEGDDSIVLFNDSRYTTHDDVLAVLDKAIASVTK